MKEGIPMFVGEKNIPHKETKKAPASPDPEQKTESNPNYEEPRYYEGTEEINREGGWDEDE